MLSKKELSEIYQTYVAILKKNGISLFQNFLLFDIAGDDLFYINIHSNYYEYLVNEKGEVSTSEKYYSEDELFYAILKHNIKYEYYCKTEIINNKYKMFSLLNFEWANRFYLSLDDEDKKYISFLDK